MKHPKQLEEAHIGMRVKIHPDSNFHSQCDEVGTITDYDHGDWWNVRFDNGYQNGYRTWDLMLGEEPANNKEALKFLTKE